MSQYFGKYRGSVLDNVDPMRMGRIQVKVPDISPSPSWAMPCVPFAGPECGDFAVPPVGAHVWVEYERGDPGQPIWSGCFWGSAAEVPALGPAALPAQTIVLQTAGQHVLAIRDLPGPAGGIMLKTATGAMISISDTGIVIANGKGATITLIGPAVDVNEGALSVV
jgi:uncharacterized protein involved in type VI secretion and phage assembly